MNKITTYEKIDYGLLKVTRQFNSTKRTRACMKRVD